jgi:endonuclease/exonuclease/phosphatase family metal-dependent hydrolase
MTYNVHGCVGVDGRLDVSRIAAVVARSRPDIVALQELDVGRSRSGGVDQAHTIASRLGMRFHFHAALKVAEEQYGDAILTGLPMRIVKSGPLPNLRRVRGRGLEDRGALWVAVDVGGGRELQVVNTHLGLVPLEQRAQARALLGPDWTGHPACCDPAILLGDFNATPRYKIYRELSARLRDVQRTPDGDRVRRWSVRTFPSRMPMLRIDHIFASPSIEVLGVHAPDGALEREASDHLPLVADLHVASTPRHSSDAGSR